jgi:hypothetical protein
MSVIVADQVEIRRIIVEAVREALAGIPAAKPAYPDGGWLSASQAAKACGVSRGTIHRWIVDGVIPRESLISSGRVHRVSAGWCMRRSA